MPIVICALGGDEDPRCLPRSAFAERNIRGGERTLYELSVAVAATGRDVELRGLIAEGDLRELAAGAGARPKVDLEPRLPGPDDLVILPEGLRDPLPYARVALSPARAMLFLLAPPGLMGWPFITGWSVPDPLSVPMDALARLEHFQAMAAAGYELLTHSPGIADRAEAAGTACTWLGSGTPVPFPEAGRRSHDVATVEDNRWAPVARRAVAGLAATHLPIPRVPHDRMLRLLGSARTLAWPSRVEGHARIQVEARAMGTVPVALDSNPFAAGLDEKGGSVLVSSLDQMREEIERLLAAPDRLEEVSERAMASAREQVAWEPYVERVDAMLREPRPRDPARGARDSFGRSLADAIEEVFVRRLSLEESKVEELEAHLRESRGGLWEAVARAEAAERRVGELAEDLGRTRERLSRVDSEVQDHRAVRQRRSVRLALTVSRLAGPYFALRKRLRRRSRRAAGREPGASVSPR